MYANLWIEGKSFALRLNVNTVLEAAGQATHFCAGIAIGSRGAELALTKGITQDKPRGVPCFELREWRKIEEFLHPKAQGASPEEKK